MNPELLTQYLKHLDGLLDALQKKEHIEFADVVPVRSELRDFRARISNVAFLRPEVRKLFETIDINIDDKLLEGSKKTIFMNLYSVIGFGSPVLRAMRAERKEKIDREISRIRAEIRTLAFSIKA